MTRHFQLQFFNSFVDVNFDESAGRLEAVLDRIYIQHKFSISCHLNGEFV